jgi:hypothetical protein
VIVDWWCGLRRVLPFWFGVFGSLLLLLALLLGLLLHTRQGATPVLAAALPLNGQWTPTSLRGDATALLRLPQQPATLLAATLSGVSRSTDAGTTWQPDGSGIQGAAIFVLAATPDSANVWAGSFNGRVYMRTGSAPHVVWQPISPVLLTDPNLGPMPIYSLAVSPLPGHPLLAGSMGAIYSGTSSYDGRTWQWQRVWQWGSTNFNAGGPAGCFGGCSNQGNNGISAGSGGGAVTSLLVAPWDPHLAFASLFQVSPALLASHDGGRAWSPGAGNLPGDLPAQDLAAGNTQARQIFLTTMGDGVWEQQGGGAWQDISAGLPQRHAMPLLAAPPPSTGVLYAGTMASGVYEKLGSAAWRPLGRGLYGLAATVSGLAETTTAHPTLLAATSAGVYRYLPNG